MKRMAALFLALCLCANLCACKSPEDEREQEMEAASYVARAAKEEANKAWKDYERLLELKEQLDAIQEKISKLEKGTDAYKAAVEENNRLVRQIISEFPEMGQYLISE